MRAHRATHFVCGVAALALGMSVAGCSGGSGDPPVIGLGDPEPAASIAPLEVVLTTCVLNRDSVAPGEHEVAVVGTGTVTITDSGGATVATLERTDSITTKADTYTFTCTVDGVQTGSATVDSRS